jgi:hypothetical protein
VVRLAALALVAGLSLATAACGDERPQSGTGSTTETTAPPPLKNASTDPVTVAPTATETALLTDVRVAAHDGYERIVFEFRNVLPGYDVRYVEPPVVADGSGDEVPVDGAAILQIRMENALDADLTQESAPATYTGPTRLSPDTPTIEELVRTGGFEAVLTWVAGLSEERPFTVTTLGAPDRIVIDVVDG